MADSMEVPDLVISQHTLEEAHTGSTNLLKAQESPSCSKGRFAVNTWLLHANSSTSQLHSQATD